MNKMDSQLRVLVSDLPMGPDPSHAEMGRLVLVLSDVTEEAVLASRVIALAKSRRLGVLLLGVAASPERADELRRKLVILGEFIRDAGCEAENRVEASKDWIRMLAALVGSGDMLACYVPAKGTARRLPVLDLLSTQLHTPVYLLQDSEEQLPEHSSLQARITAWVGSLAIMAGFSWLQLQMSQVQQASAYSLLLLASVPAEIALIWFWNSILG